MRWLSFLRDGSETFGYVVGDAAAGEGVVDAGERSDFASLREAIAADALTDLAAKCGASADLALATMPVLMDFTCKK